MYVSVSAVRAVVDELQRQGIPSSTLCEAAGVTAAELGEATLRLPIDRYNRIVRSARALSTTPALGLRVGAAAPPGALHVVGYILGTCCTLREAFAQFLQYSALIKEGADWQIVEEGDRARFIYAHDVIAPDNACFDAEACFALVVKIGQQFTGIDSHPEIVRFRHETPSYASEYARIFGCEVSFDQAVNEIVFPRSFLDLEQMHQDDRLRSILKERATELLERRSSKEAFIDQLRDLLRLEVETGAPQVSRLADRLGITLRTLERQVHDRGLSLTRLMEDARRDAACSALRLTPASIKGVAYRLGFSEPSAFHRAFKRWTGMTPARYRQATATGDAGSGGTLPQA